MALRYIRLSRSPNTVLKCTPGQSVDMIRDKLLTTSRASHPWTGCYLQKSFYACANVRVLCTVCSSCSSLKTLENNLIWGYFPGQGAFPTKSAHCVNCLSDLIPMTGNAPYGPLVALQPRRTSSLYLLCLSHYSTAQSLVLHKYQRLLGGHDNGIILLT